MTISELKKARSPHQPLGRWIRPEKRLAIYLRDGFRCVYCGCDLHGADPRDLNLDHVKPKCEGGTNEANNLVTACRSCNSSRQDTPVSRFASDEARKVIRRNLRRSLKPYLVTAKALLEDKTGRHDR